MNGGKIIIVVEGGCVQAVYSNTCAKCEVIDLDLHDDEQEHDRAHNRADRLENWSKQPDAELKEILFEE